MIIGSTLLLSGVFPPTDQLIKSATTATNQANVHQLATVVELYYSDHDQYPNVKGGKALVDILELEGYLKNRPINPNVFKYEPKDNGQDYILKLK